MKDIKQYMEEQCESMISDIEGFVNIPSISTDLEKVDEALDYILNLAADMGFQTRSVLDHRIGLIECGEGDETIGILSHVDVVPPGDLSDWNTPPFEMVQKDGKLFGRGTLDDKGAIIASLYAMKYVKDSGLPLHKKMQMILGTQEEVEWTDMEDYVKEFPLPDYGFTPDGEFPVCNIEKGSMDITLRFPLDKEFGEDGWYLTELAAGQATNSVPGKCRAVISRVEGGEIKEQKKLQSSGKSVHSCQPEKGENAIFSMENELTGTELVPNRLLAVLKLLKEKFQSIYGKELDLYSESEYYNGEYVHRNVFSPTVVYIENDELKVNVNVRFAFGADENEITEKLNALAECYGGSANLDAFLPAVYVSKERPFMKVFADAYEKGCGRSHEFVLAYGGSYAKAMPNIVSWGPIFPGDEDTCHEDNEYISIDCLLANGRIFAETLAKIVLAEEHYK